MARFRVSARATGRRSANRFGMAGPRSLLLFVLAFGLMAFSSNAQAAGSVDIVSFDAGLTNYQAGGHPDAFVSFRLATEPASIPGVGDPSGRCMDVANPPTFMGQCKVVKGGAPKDIVVDLPKGIFGNPRSIPQCTLDELTVSRCPITAQVGIQSVHLISIGIPNGNLIPPGGERVPVYNMVPERGEVAKLGFRVKGAVNSFVSIKVRSNGDYGLNTSVGNIFSGLPVWGTDLTVWGDPFSAANTPNRLCETIRPGGDPQNPDDRWGCEARVDSKPFMVAPHECGVDGRATLRVRTWSRPSDDDWSTATSSRQQVHGCDRLSFQPRVSFQPTTSAADSSTGLNVELTFPHQFDNVNGLESPPLKDARVTLPLGVSVNPSSADGLAACPDEALRLTSLAPVECPLASKIGEVEAETPVLNERLTGGIYLRPQNSMNPESGEMFRIAIVLENEERGLSIRLPGKIFVNRSNGQITALFENNPQLPVSRIGLRFKTGERTPIATPNGCGTMTTNATLTSWGGQTANLSDSFTIDCSPGLGSFNPAFMAGVTNPAARASSPFMVRFTREDRQQYLSDIAMEMPPGLTAKIAGVRELCGEARAAAGTCSEASRIGSVTSGAGAGAPLFVPGRVYLTHGYKGGAFGLSIVVPAVAGPFDLGTVVVRAAIHVDRRDTSLTVISDPLPSILNGVPLRIRYVRADIDRPGFMVNPTNCTRQSVAGVIGSLTGQRANVSSRFQIASCGSLAYKPKLTFRIGARGRTAAESTTPLEVVLRMPNRNANNGSVAVTLPPNVNSRLAALRGACSVEDARARRCGRLAIVGSGVAITPLLRDPVTGPVYIVRTVGNRLPDLWVALRGQGDASLVEIDLIGRVRIVGSRLQLRTTFAEIPDVPVSSFRLNFVSGRQAPIGLVRGICNATVRRGMVAGLRMRAASGRTVVRNQRMTIAGCSRGSAAGRRASRRASRRARRSARG